MKAMLKTWTDLYKTFSRLAAMVTNADANICCEELCDKIAGSLETDTLQVGRENCLDLQLFMPSEYCNTC